jgi:asparagine synthase (glutamine-hydrolysing)
MCGICGVFSPNNSNTLMKTVVSSMHRRGPDDAGVWMNNDKTIGFGQTRLSIIDLSFGGHQPMVSRNLRYVIVFNGEIYNYKELKIDLEKKGAFFLTNSDTEVVLWAWQILGPQTFQILRGMFAFAIWDTDEEKLILCRDRMGIKPLLFTTSAESFVFASTLSAILSSGLIPPILNNQAFIQFLATGSVLQPNTIIQGVQVLMPGYYMVFHKGELTFEKYWNLERNENLVHAFKGYGFYELVKATRDMLEESCRFHMVSDVPIGSFLSGGVDSTAITALMAQNSPFKLKTFSVGFESAKDYSNELSEARSASDFIGTDHTEVILNGNDIVNNIDDFLSVLDQPSIDGLNTYFISKAASKDVKVALSGLGADELFAGYNHFAWPTIFRNYRSSYLDSLTSKIYRQFPKKIFYSSFLSTLSTQQRLATIRRQFSDSAIRKIINENIRSDFSYGEIERYAESLNLGSNESVYEYSLYELNNYLLNTLLRDTDTVGMGNSIEVRPPFLDHKLVEFALSLPDSTKWNNGVGKMVLKEATKDLLPKNFFLRKKTGFTLPISRWIYNELNEEFRSVLSDPFALNFISREAVKKFLWDLNFKKNGWQLYQIFVFLKWAKKVHLISFV